MPDYRITTIAQGSTLQREEQLAWRLAALAIATPPTDADAVEMVGCRLVDSVGVAVAALALPSVQAAMAQAAAHPGRMGAPLIGSGTVRRADCGWAGFANGTAIRELDLHDNFYGFGVAHPADTIAPLLAVAQARRISGADLVRGLLAAYEAQCALAEAIDLNAAGVDHVAHLGPAVAVGLGAMLALPVDIVFEAVNQAAHVSVSPLQARKGAISSWKGAAPGHVGKLAIEAVDRAMRGGTAPQPIYEGTAGLLATLFRAPDGASIALPDAETPRRRILETYPKAHAGGYHGQVLVDIARRLRPRIANLSAIEEVVIETKAYAHNYVGSGANDPEKMNPEASRETLDHSLMYIFAVALEDGGLDHEASYAPERARRPETVRLWHRVRTVSSPEWSTRYRDPSPLDKDHGATVTVRLGDGTVLAESLAVPDAHPRGAAPFGRDDYAAKFVAMTERLVTGSERQRFLDAALRVGELQEGELDALAITAEGVRPMPVPPGLLD